MTAHAATMLREFFPRHAAKRVAKELSVSFATGRLYVEHPELFPRSRAEQLLALLEQQQAEQERRITERRQLLDSLRNELRESLGVSSAGGDLLGHKRGR